jgi:3-oxoacyl-[acyl-carrier protein] reductase
MTRDMLEPAQAARDLEGRVALVTGAGHGIGLAIAAKLGGAGASVVVNDLNRDIADGAVAAVEAAGGQAVACPGDITAGQFPARFVQTALDSFGTLDIVVNNAGYATYADAIDMSDRQWGQVLDVLLTAPFRILRAAGGYFRAHPGDGRARKAVNIASVGGIAGSPGSVSYAAAKAGLIGLTRTLAKEWGRYGVTVNAVAPGLIRTRQTEGPAGGHRDIDVGGERLALPGVPLAALEPEIPVGRIGEPQDVANAVYLLCLPESDYISGEVVVVSGGWRP